MGKTLVSVIIPVYNVAEYVEKCLGSIRRQSYSELDIVVVDDGSTDGSGTVCDEMAKCDARIRVFHKKNGGLSGARNFGLKKAKGEYICFVDSDDMVERCFVERLYKAMVKSQSDIAVCGYNNDIPKTEETITGRDSAKRLLINQKNIDIIAWNKMYRKSLFSNNDIWFPEGKNYEDCFTTYKLLSKASLVTYVSQTLYCYAERANSITNSADWEERLKARELAAREAVEYFGDDQELRDAAEISLLLAKYAFLDAAIKDRIDKKYEKKTLTWLRGNVKKFKKNEFLTKKLRVYNVLSVSCGGVLYKIFRKLV